MRSFPVTNLKRAPFLLAGLFGTAALLVAGGVYLESFVPPAEAGFVIELTQEGFQPQTLTIRAGDTIRFTNSFSRPFWPASNIHPTHELYSEFDAKGPLEPGASWSFRFEREGPWRFHDHLNPFFTGLVLVKPEASADIGLGGLTNADCSNVQALEVKEQEKCWDMTLYESLVSGGAAAAMETFQNLYTSFPAFVQRGCHWHAHRLGEEAYGMYRQTQELDLPPQASSCSYGFVHGFLEHLFREQQDAGAAVHLCEDLTLSYQETLPRIRLNCYHAIGHGFMDDPQPVEIWGDANAMLEKPLSVCASIAEDSQVMKECYDGAYNTLINFMTVEQYGLSYSTENPFAFCATQAQEHQWPCYYEFAQLLDFAGERDLGKMAQFVSGIEDPRIAGMVISTAAAGLMQPGVPEQDFPQHIAACQALEAFLVPHCVRGMVGGLMAHGEPGKEYEKALAFCSSPVLRQSEGDACFENLVVKMRDVYSAETRQEACKLFPAPFAEQCVL